VDLLEWQCYFSKLKALSMIVILVVISSIVVEAWIFC
jgi:hypothetical protein